MSKDKPTRYDPATGSKRLNIGAEGEEPNCVQVNHPWILRAGKDFVASRNGEQIGLAGIQEAGPLVICDPLNLPFKDNAFDEIIANGVPIDCHTYLGPGYSSKELARVCRKGFCPTQKPDRLIRLGDDPEITIEDNED